MFFIPLLFQLSSEGNGNLIHNKGAALLKRDGGRTGYSLFGKEAEES